MMGEEPSPLDTVSQLWRSCFLSFRPKGEIFKSRDLQNQDFSALASK